MTVLRSTTFQLHVKNEDGVTKMRTFTRAVSDADKTTEMLNESLGENVTVTTKTTRSTKELTQQARAQVTQIERANRVYKQQAEQLRHQITLVGKTEQEQAQLNAQFNLGANATEEQRKEIAQLTAQYQGLITAQGGAQGSMHNLRGVAQNFGWQIQDVAVQMQMGTDAFIIFSQQGSQIASSFGAAGAAVGAVIAIVGAAMPALIAYLDDTATSTKELDEAQESLNAIFEMSSWSVKGFTSDLQELYEVDQQLAELKIISATFDAEKVIKDARIQVNEFSKDISSLGDGYRFTNSLQEEFNEDVEDLSKKFGLSREEVVKLNDAYARLSIGGPLSEFADIVKELAIENPKANESFFEMASGVAETAFQAGLAEKQLESLRELIGGELTPTNTELVDSIYDTIQAYTDKTIALDLNKREQAIYNELTQLGSDATEEEVNSLTKSINLYYDRAEAIDVATQADKDRQKQAEDAMKATEKFVKDFEKMQGKVDPAGKILDRYLESFDLIDEAQRRNMVGEAEALNLRTQAFEKYTDDINKLANKTSVILTEDTLKFAQDSVSLASSLSGMMTSLANEWSVGAEQMKAQLENMNGIQKAAFFFSRAVAAAEAYINGISLGTKMAAQFSNPGWVAAGTAIGAASAGAILGTTFAGFFDNGGYIPSGQKGIVSEYGDELVNGVMVQGPANVTSRVDTAAAVGGTNMYVEVVNQAAGVSVQTEKVDDNHVRMVVREEMAANGDKMVAASLSKKGSKGQRAVKGQFNITSKF